MININVDGKKYKMPDRLTIEQWVMISAVDINDPIVWPKLLSDITGVPSEDWEAGGEEPLGLALLYIANLLDSKLDVSIPINLELLTFGEFIDLDVLLNMDVNMNLKDIMNILGPDVIYADEAISIVGKYIKYRSFTYKKYSYLFGAIDDNSEDIKDIEVKQSDVAAAWYDIIVNLADEQYLRLNDVTDTAMQQALTFLSWKKKKNEKEYNKIKHDELQRSSR